MGDICRLILDVDTGIDDAMAILFALNRPTIHLEALTTTFGNTDIESATANTLRILDLVGVSDIPVARGAGRSLVYPFTRGTDVHGSKGLGDVILPEPKGEPILEHASDLIVRMARQSPGEISLCAVGPMTNTAIALAKAPEIGTMLKQIVVMGSTIFHPGIHGITPPMADYNFWSDPEAAQIVLRSGARLTVVGMDVTMTVLLTDQMSKEIQTLGGTVGTVAMEIAAFYTRVYRKMYPGVEGCFLHDPLAVAIAEDHTIATTEPMCVDVELRGDLTRGQMIADRRRTAASRQNADVCIRVDRDRFSRRFVEAVGGVEGARRS